MRVVLTTLSNQLYEESRNRLVESAKRFGISEVRPYDFDDVKKSAFYKQNEEILSHVPTMGYWLWKPYIISEVLKTLSQDDIVIYCDAGIEVVADLNPLITICKEKEAILLFGNALELNSYWTKRDCFVLMGCDKEFYWNGPHCDAALSLFKKNDLSSQFINDWLKYGCNKNIITGLSNICGKENLESFKDHRYDQSILSLLAQKNNVSLYRMPTQYGNHYKMYANRVPGEFNCISQSDQRQVSFYHTIPYYNSPYGQLLNHHRSRNKNIKQAVVWNDPKTTYNDTNANDSASRTILRKILGKLRLKSN